MRSSGYRSLLLATERAVDRDPRSGRIPLQVRLDTSALRDLCLTRCRDVSETIELWPLSQGEIDPTIGMS